MLYLSLLWLFVASPFADDGRDGVVDECRYDTSMAVTMPIDEIISEDDPVLGNPEAEVVAVEFFDPNCVHCRRLHPIMEEVLDAYGDRIRYYKKPFALSPRSVSQVAAILIAARDAKFYEMTEAQMESPHAPYLDDDQLVDIARSVGLDPEAFRAALERGDLLNRVQLLKQQARAAGVRGTPTLVIQRADQVVAPESRSVECISALIEAELDQ